MFGAELAYTGRLRPGGNGSLEVRHGISARDVGTGRKAWEFWGWMQDASSSPAVWGGVAIHFSVQDGPLGSRLGKVFGLDVRTGDEIW